MKIKQTLTFVSAGAMLAGCGIADTIAGIQDTISQLGQIDISPEGLQGMMGQAGSSFAAAGDQLAANVDMSSFSGEGATDRLGDQGGDFGGFGGGGAGAGGGGGGGGFGAAAGFRPSAEEDDQEAEAKKILGDCATRDLLTGDGTEVRVDFADCDDKTGIIETASKLDGDRLSVDVKYIEYSEGVSEENGYVFMDGSQSIVIQPTSDGGLTLTFTDNYDTKFRRADIYNEFNLQGSVNINYGTTTLLNGSQTIVGELSSGQLAFTSLEFDDTCSSGPIAGVVKLTSGADYVEVEIIDCDNANITTKKGSDESVAKMGLKEKTEFFEDFQAGFSNFQTRMGDQKDDFDRIDDLGALAEAWDNCDSPVTNDLLKPFEGTWCTGWPIQDMNGDYIEYTFVECMKVCNLDASKEFPDYLVRSGIGQWSGNEVDIDQSSFTVNVDSITCLDPWVNYNGVLKANGTSQGFDPMTEQNLSLVNLEFTFNDPFAPAGEEPMGFEEHGYVADGKLVRGFNDVEFGEFFAFLTYTKESVSSPKACAQEDWAPIDEAFGFGGEPMPGDLP